MTLILGLGNPGAKFGKTRHNLGFIILDHFRNEQAGFDNWQENFQAFTSEGEISGQKIILAKPQTFMNQGGQAAKALADYYKIPSQNIWVIHDDIDLPFGILRVSQNASAAGHKGARSVIAALGTKDFVRFRIGIRSVGQTFLSSFFNRARSTEKFVLQKFTRAELDKITEIKQNISTALTLAIKEGIAEAMNKFN